MKTLRYELIHTRCSILQTTRWPVKCARCWSHRHCNQSLQFTCTVALLLTLYSSEIRDKKLHSRTVSVHFNAMTKRETNPHSHFTNTIRNKQHMYRENGCKKINNVLQIKRRLKFRFINTDDAAPRPLWHCRVINKSHNYSVRTNLYTSPGDITVLTLRLINEKM